MTEYSDGWPGWKAGALLIAIVAVAVSVVLGIAALVNWSRTPGVPDQCFDHAWHDKVYAYCDHSDHRLVVEGEYVVCRCTRPADG